MSLTDRDKKVVMVIVPLLVLVGYWFLLLAPKRDEAAKAGAELTEQREARDKARTQLAGLESAKTDFAGDYSQLVRLGKAIPSSVDMPSLIVQLDKAARGTGIKFTKIAAGEREPAAAPPPSSGGASGDKGSTPPAGSATTTPAAGGGAPAQSAPGQAGEAAASDVDSANGQNGAGAQAQDVKPEDAQTSETAKDGKLPVGGAAGGAKGAAAAPDACAPGLECIPLEFAFNGRFFALADFFHRLKRFVEVANDRVLVRGRLLTVDTLKFSSGESFPKLKAEISATVYLAPKTQGQTAGATPQGPAPGGATPAGAAPGSASPQPASSSQPPTAATTP